MPSQHKGELVRRETLIHAQRGAMILMLLCFAGIAALLMRAYVQRATAGSENARPIGDDRALASNSTSLPVLRPVRTRASAPGQAQGGGPPIVDLLPKLTPLPQPWPTTYPLMYIGVVAGHWQYDSGAVCPDGLREVDITLPVAQQVVAILSWQGYQVDLLSEYDDALTGYRADAFISIHADSCDFPGLSGFKVARVEHSFVPEEEDRLVDCLWETYAADTGLAPHKDTITPDMRNYHAFRTISPYTPGAIIEIGFMLEDRWLLENGQDAVASGIVDGLICFLAEP